MKLTVLVVAVLVAVVAAEMPYVENQPIIQAPAKGVDLDPMPARAEVKTDPTNYRNQGVIDSPPRGLTEREQIAEQYRIEHQAYLDRLLAEQKALGGVPPAADSPARGAGSEADENEDKIVTAHKEVVPRYTQHDKATKAKNAGPDIPPPSDSPAGHRPDNRPDMLLDISEHRAEPVDAFLQTAESIDDVQALYAEGAAKNAVRADSLPQIDAPSDDQEEVTTAKASLAAKLRGAKEKKWAPRTIHSDMPTIGAPGNEGPTKAAVAIAAAKKVVDEHPYQSWAKRAEAARERAEGTYNFAMDSPGDVAQVEAKPVAVAAKVQDENKWVNNVSAEMAEPVDVLPTASVSDVDQAEAPQVVAVQPRVPHRNWDHNVNKDVKVDSGMPMIDGPGDEASEAVPVAQVKKVQYRGEPSPAHIPAPSRSWDDME